MKRIQLFWVAGVALLLTACSGGTATQTPVAYEAYEIDETVEGEEGAPGQLHLKFDIPQGEGSAVENVTKAIRALVDSSAVAEELGKPAEGTLKEVADHYLELFKKGMASGELAPMCVYELLIEHGYQNKACQVLRVSDGIYGNGGPYVRDIVVRLSDGHVMEQQELLTVNDEKLGELVTKYANDEQKEQMEMAADFNVSPSDKGIVVLYHLGSHLFDEVTIPTEEFLPLMTEEGKTLFTNEAFDVDATEQVSAEESEDAAAEKEADVVKGDLGAFELRGPVKECIYVSGDYKVTRTFDEQGIWTSEDGKSLKSKFPAGVERDNAGRIVKGKLNKMEPDLCIVYQYNDKGLVEHIDYNEYLDGGSAEDYTYDADGYLTKKSVEYMGMDAYDEESEEPSGPTVMKYSILEKDQHGNWTKRKCDNSTEQRTITYY